MRSSSSSSTASSKPSRSSTSTKPLRSKGPSRSSSHRSTLSAQKTEIRINVYDLLPPGKVASVLWALGGSLLHTGVVIRNKEYAYGGHDKHGISGVYYTKPRQEPPGGTFRQGILQGFTIRSDAEIEAVIKEASDRFQGTSYNLLKNNCNHFTSYLCQRLTGRTAPRWINRAASIGVALPCVVPKDWICPPDYETANGDLLEEDEEEDDDERTRMLRKEQWRQCNRVSEEEQERWNSEMDRIGSSGRSSRRSYGYEQQRPRVVSLLRDTSGREVPAAERAPLPRRMTDLN